MKYNLFIVLLFSSIITISGQTSAKTPEKLNRGLVALKTDNGVFLSWRLLGTENPDVR